MAVVGDEDVVELDGVRAGAAHPQRVPVFADGDAGGPERDGEDQHLGAALGIVVGGAGDEQVAGGRAAAEALGRGDPVAAGDLLGPAHALDPVARAGAHQHQLATAATLRSSASPGCPCWWRQTAAATRCVCIERARAVDPQWCPSSRSSWQSSAWLDAAAPKLGRHQRRHQPRLFQLGVVLAHEAPLGVGFGGAVGEARSQLRDDVGEPGAVGGMIRLGRCGRRRGHGASLSPLVYEPRPDVTSSKYGLESRRRCQGRRASACWRG